MEKEILNFVEVEMNKVVSGWKTDIAKIRTGRASVSMLDSVVVNFYGTMTPIIQIGQISTPEPQQIVIKPYDRSQISEVVSAINKADLGINPISDAECIRINIPSLTEDVRKDLVKKMNKELENFKVRIRNIRRDAIEKAKKNKEISEDIVRELEKQIQILTDGYIKIIQDLAKEKEIVLMTI